MKGTKNMFRKFLERIIAAEGREDAINNIFYGGIEYDENDEIVNIGIDLAYQWELLSWKDHEMLLAIIEKMAY